MSRANIVKVFNQVDPTDLEAGARAYPAYQKTVKDLARLHGFGFVQTTAAFVALSPNNSYEGNLRALASLMIGINQGLTREQINTGTYNHCRDRAFDYITGEKDFLAETKGPKTRSFFFNILKPEDREHITIDGHMFNVWTGEKRTMKEVAISSAVASERSYNRIAKDFKAVAASRGLIPCQLQATLWFTWKRINNVVYNSQLDLLSGDHWGLNVRVDKIRPFENNILRAISDRAQLSRSRGDDLGLFRAVGQSSLA